MVIYGALSDPLSYYENIGYDETMTLPSYANGDSANNISINGFIKPIKINVNNKKVFINMITINSSNSYGVSGDLPLFEVINDSGKTLFSIYWQYSSPNKTVFVVHDPVTGARKHQTYTDVLITKTQGMPLTLCFDTNTETATARIYMGPVILADFTIDKLSGLLEQTIAYIRFPVISSPRDRGFVVASVVVSDELDQTLVAVPLRADKIESNTGFNGSVTDINSWLPDRSYMGSFAETNAGINVKMAVAPGTVLVKDYIKSKNINFLAIKTFTGCRYVLDGGISANFRIQTKVGSTGVEDRLTTVPANQFDTFYLIKAGNQVDISSLSLSFNDISISISLE